MNSLAQNILYIYLIVFLAVLIFDVICVFYRKANNRKLKKLEASIKKKIEDEDIKRVSIQHINFLIKKLKKLNYFLAFTRVVEEMNEKEREVYLKNLKRVFLKILPYYQKEEIIRRTYFVYFLSLHPCIYSDHKNGIIQFLLQSVTSNSVYLRENSLKALYSLGNEEYIKEALYQMNYLNITHHHKLITDGLLKYRGNVEDLVKMLKEELKDYNENYKVAVINYFSYRKIDCKDIVFEILTSKKEPVEARIAAIRYFANIKYDKVLPILYQFIEEDKSSWEYAAIAAGTLRNYNSKETVEYLVMALKSYNWYVRNNAAASLIRMRSKEKLELIIKNIKDRYAEDALKYQMSLQGNEG